MHAHAKCKSNNRTHVCYYYFFFCNYLVTYHNLEVNKKIISLLNFMIINTNYYLFLLYYNFWGKFGYIPLNSFQFFFIIYSFNIIILSFTSFPFIKLFSLFFLYFVRVFSFFSFFSFCLCCDYSVTYHNLRVNKIISLLNFMTINTNYYLFLLYSNFWGNFWFHPQNW